MRPLSTTTRTPSMVSDVSAIDVASTILRRPGARRRDGEILGARVHRAIERSDVDVPAADPRLEHFGDAADLALPRQENEDGAGLFVKRRERHARDLVLDAGAWGPPDVAGHDGPGAAFAFDQRRGAEEGANPRAVERRRHDQNPQVFAQAGLRVERERKAEIGLERALVKLVEHDRADALERRIVEDHAGEHALGHDLDPRRARGEALEPDAQADRLADALAQGRRHARGRGARRESARFEEEEALAASPGLVEERERGARRLARAGRGDEDRARARGQRRLKGAERVVDRQGLGEGAHRPVLRRAGRFAASGTRTLSAEASGRGQNRSPGPSSRRHGARSDTILNALNLYQGLR